MRGYAGLSKSVPGRSAAVTFRLRRLQIVCLIAAALNAGAEEPVSKAPAAVPEWSMGVLSIREFGKTLDKVGAYANQVLPNFGALARQATLNLMFKAFPANAGLKPDAPAFLYALDPLASGHR